LNLIVNTAGNPAGGNWGRGRCQSGNPYSAATVYQWRRKAKCICRTLVNENLFVRRAVGCGNEKERLIEFNADGPFVLAGFLLQSGLGWGG
jgi:hypothetical protein